MVDIVGGASVTSKRSERMLTGLRSVHATDCTVTLENGKDYTDWQMGLHGAIYGYRPMWWVNKIMRAVELKALCANSYATLSEHVAAEMLAMRYTDVEAVRFMVNGSDPCAAAVKLARAITGRDKMLVYGYHGTASAYCTPPEVNARPNLPATDMRRGTLPAEREAFVSLEWEPTSTSKKEPAVLDDTVAAVVVECPPVDGGRKTASSWLQALADQAHTHDALFVLDEVVTGFRYGPTGAAGYYDLHHLVDLYCFGKTLGNGYPVAALAGRRAVMDELTNGVHFSGTFFGEPIGMEVAAGMLAELDSNPPWHHLCSRGELLKKMWNDLDLPWNMVGHPTRPILEPRDGYSEDERLELENFRRYMLRKGHIVTDHPWYISTEHTKKHITDLGAAARQYEVKGL